MDCRVPEEQLVIVRIQAVQSRREIGERRARILCKHLEEDEDKHIVCTRDSDLCWLRQDVATVCNDTCRSLVPQNTAAVMLLEDGSVAKHETVTLALDLCDPREKGSVALIGLVRRRCVRNTHGTGELSRPSCQYLQRRHVVGARDKQATRPRSEVVPPTDAHFPGFVVSSSRVAAQLTVDRLVDSHVECRHERIRPAEAAIALLLGEPYAKVGCLLVPAGEQESPDLLQVRCHLDWRESRRRRQEEPLMAEGDHLFGGVAEDQCPDAAVPADEGFLPICCTRLGDEPTPGASISFPSSPRLTGPGH